MPEEFSWGGKWSAIIRDFYPFVEELNSVEELLKLILNLLKMAAMIQIIKWKIQTEIHGIRFTKRNKQLLLQ